MIEIPEEKVLAPILLESDGLELQKRKQTQHEVIPDGKVLSTELSDSDDIEIQKHKHVEVIPVDNPNLLNWFNFPNLRVRSTGLGVCEEKVQSN